MDIDTPFPEVVGCVLQLMQRVHYAERFVNNHENIHVNIQVCAADEMGLIHMHKRILIKAYQNAYFKTRKKNRN